MESDKRRRTQNHLLSRRRLCMFAAALRASTRARAASGAWALPVRQAVVLVCMRLPAAGLRIAACRNTNPTAHVQQQHCSDQPLTSMTPPPPSCQQPAAGVSSQARAKKRPNTSPELELVLLRDVESEHPTNPPPRLLVSTPRLSHLLSLPVLRNRQYRAGRRGPVRQGEARICSQLPGAQGPSRHCQHGQPRTLWQGQGQCTAATFSPQPF